MRNPRDQRLRSFAELHSRIRLDAPVVTLFSGGLDSTYLLLRLKQLGYSRVHALSVDLGEGEGLERTSQIASELGVHLHHHDARDLFAEDYVSPAIKAQAVYLDTHPVSSTLSRPLIAVTAFELATTIGASAILHTANRSQNSLRRLNGALELLGWSGIYGSPYDSQPVSRADKLKELANNGIDFPETRLISGDSNLWCREYESGCLDDPESHTTPPGTYVWTAPGARPEGDVIKVSFTAGVPTEINDVPRSLAQIIEILNIQVGRHGMGRYSGLEHLDDGSKVFEIREMPAAWLLFRSARHLEAASLSAEMLQAKLVAEQIWVREALEGRWFGSLKRASEAFIEVCSEAVTGSVTWEQSDGIIGTTKIVSQNPTYIRDREQWEADEIGRESRSFHRIHANH